jgi:hypothetical protein
VVTPAAAVLHDHGLHDAARDTAVTPLVEDTHLLPGLPGLARQLHADLVVHLQGADGHAYGLAHVVDEHRVQTLAEQAHALVEVGAEGARGEEAEGIVDDDRCLADLLRVVEGLRQGLVRGLLAHDDLDQGHLVDRREKVDADEVLGPAAGLGELRDRQRRGIRAPGTALGQLALELPGHRRA